MTRAKTDNGTVPPLLPLEAAEAAIQTTTITIRALHVGKKQMTQSVFRQLPEADLVDQEEVKLDGVPWGWVNYRWGDMDWRRTNFIFQQGARIYRCAFHVRDSSSFCVHHENRPKSDEFHEMRRRFHAEIRAYHCARILEGWGPVEKVGPRGNTCLSWNLAYRFDPLGIDDEVDDLPDGGGKFAVRTPSGRTTYLDLRMLRQEPQDVPEKESYSNHAKDVRERNEDLKFHQESLRSWLTREVTRIVGRPLSSAEIHPRIGAIRLQAEDYNRRWDALMDQLRTVEQIFIAV